MRSSSSPSARSKAPRSSGAGSARGSGSRAGGADTAGAALGAGTVARSHLAPAQGSTAALLIQAAAELSSAVGRLRFSPPVAFVYNPLEYAWAPHQEYLSRYAGTPKQVLFLGMNPGPFGMMQTGVPFGEVAAVRDWMKLGGAVHAPARMHPKKPIEGFSCARSEVSGRRLWGLFQERFGSAEVFFTRHFVVNYCPLAFLDEGGRNLTPDKLPAAESAPLFAACDAHLRRLVQALQPEWIIGVGDFAEKRALELWPQEGKGTGRSAGSTRAIRAGQPPPRSTCGPKVGKVLHPSPASPAANRGWSAAATRQLEETQVWRPLQG